MGNPEPAAVTETKKKSRKSKLKVKDFPNKGAYLDACIEQLQRQKEEWVKFGDGVEKKKAAKVRKFIADLNEMKKDPKYNSLIMDLRKELNAPAPAQAKK